MKRAPAETVDKLLEVDSINAGYGKAQILFDVSLTVKKAKVTGLMGPNGSGKSTVLKTIFGLSRLYSGSILYKDEEVGGLKPHEVARLGIAYLPQVGNVYSNLTVQENLTMAGYSLPKDELDSGIHEVLAVFPQLKRYVGKKALVLSGGERQMLAMASALLREPALMMLDEPGTNLSPKLVDMVFDKITELNTSHNMTIFVVEQHVNKLLEVCEEIYCLVAGRIKFGCEASEFAEAEKQFELFLGLEGLK